MSMFGRREDPIERELRGAFEPSGEFERTLARHVRQSAPTVRFARASRRMFGTALAVFMLGTFASFGGVSIAAAGAHDTVAAVTHLTVSQKPVIRHTTSANDEYGSVAVKPAKVTKAKPTAKPHVVKKAKVPTVVKTSGTLPFTGLSLLTTVLASLAFVAAGLVLRRIGARDTRA